MFFVSDIFEQAHRIVISLPLQKMTYDALAKLQIPFERVDTDEAIIYGGLYPDQ